MYPVLILRAELVCIVILAFLYSISRYYRMEKDSKIFNRLILFAVAHVCLDAATVISVNNISAVPSWLNWLLHVLFYLSAILYSTELVCYVFTAVYPHLLKRFISGAHAVLTLYIICLPFLKITYVQSEGTWSSSGPGAYVGYTIALGLFIFALGFILFNWKKFPHSFRATLIPMMLVLIVCEMVQAFRKDLLFTGCAITIVTVAFFFALENPIQIFKRKAMTDALTGVRSRSSFEEDIDKLERKFAACPGDEYTFVFCDINDLRGVNNRFGHSEGDSYITLIATAISKTMKHATAIYRIGGDEFLAYYYKTAASAIEEEISSLRSECAKESEGLKYEAAVAVGYATSSVNFRSLDDVVKNADYAMYRNKTDIKSQNSRNNCFSSTGLNCTGLIDRVFDAMCASNEKNYPYITNLETGVTRISPLWREYFGLDSEFYADFSTLWEQRIHPDYLEGYKVDIAAVVNGHKQYHNYEYLAKRANGEYVRVSCHGSIYRDIGTGTATFSGFMTNHAAECSSDRLTGLRDFEQMTSEISTRMDEKKPFSVIKLNLNNFARINMLYGYSGGDMIIKRISELLTKEAGDGAEVFCFSSVNFSVLFDTDDEEMLTKYYEKIRNSLAKGVETDFAAVPIHISGGALINSGERCEIWEMRRGLAFALDESYCSQKNSLVFYNSHKKAGGVQDVALLSDIHADALGNMQYFRLRYQPIVDVAGGKTTAAEALLRWIHPEYGEITPDRFIAFLENDPCYYRLGLKLISEATRDAGVIRRIIPEFKINVNITATQLQNDGFAEDVMEILRKNSYAPEGLVLELTERCKELDSEFLGERIADLRNRGIRVAFDDLGTGYSTIKLLMDIPVDEIKLDRDFVHDLQDRVSYQLFVDSLVLGTSTAKLKYNICFEGVENQKMLEYISAYGNYLAQGYCFSKPLLFDDFKKFIEEEVKN